MTRREDDKAFIKALKSGDDRGCHAFFYKEIAGILQKIRAEVFQGRITFSELANELYLYLARERWSKLDGFTGTNGCRLRTWMIPVAWRYFVNNRERLLGRDYETEHAGERDSLCEDFRIQIAIDVNAVLAALPNRRYAEVLRLLLIEGYSARDVAERLGVKVENVYNIKHRAIAQFIKLYGER